MKNYYWLRWLAVLPAAIIGYVIASLFIEYCYKFYSGNDFGWDWLKIFNNYFLLAAKSMGAVMVFIYVSIRVAPFYKRKTGIVFITIAMVFPTLIFIMISRTPDFKNKADDYITYIFYYLGCILAFALLPKRENTDIKEEKKIVIEPITDLNPDLNVELFEITDQQFEAIKRMTHKPDMTKEEAIRRVNEVRAFKSLRQ